jgi:hypothetical protein
VTNLELLLDDRRLDGSQPIERVVGPDRIAAAVDADDMEDVRAAIEDLCMNWGGACGALLPVDRATAGLSSRWRSFLSAGTFDNLATRGLLPQQGGRAQVDGDELGLFALEFVKGEPLLSILWSQHQKPEEWATCACGLPAPDDPWYVAYLGCLGAWPMQPRPGHLGTTGLVEDYTFDRLVQVEHGLVADPGPEDLVRRLRQPGFTTPSSLSTVGLTLWRLPEAPHLSNEQVIPIDGWQRRRYASNLVVVYEPGSVEDLALLWALRGAHALYPGFPLAVPVTANVPQALAAWSDVDGDSWALRLFGIVSQPWGLVSTSVEHEALEEIAASARQASGGNWEAAEVETVLYPAARPGRLSTDVAVFTQGRARVAALSPEDRDYLNGRPARAHDPELRVRIKAGGRHLPPASPLARYLPTMPGYRGGGIEVGPNNVDDLVGIDWPSGINVLVAIAKERGLDATPSRPGKAAVSLLHALGSLQGLQPLLDPAILETLGKLGTRAGRTWFEDQVRQLHARVEVHMADEDALTRSLAIEQALENLALTATESDNANLTWDALQEKLSRDGAHEWLAWAESRGLLLRGAAIICDHCDASDWRLAAELAPPIRCRGCSQLIARPFPADRLVFRYRASEMLLHVLRLSSLPHLFAARWLAELLDKQLYGFHPGIEFRDDAGLLIGEADVVLVFTDGTLAIGECKLTPRGLRQSDVDKLESLATAIGATWTFYAVPAWRDACTDIWGQLERGLPERPRFVLTNEQLLQLNRVFWALGTNPLRSEAATPRRKAEMHSEFVTSLPGAISWIHDREHWDDHLLKED